METPPRTLRHFPLAMIVRTLMTLSLAALSLLHAAEPVKTSETFDKPQLEVVLKQLNAYCTSLAESRVHSIYLVPKLLGDSDTIDPFEKEAKPNPKIEAVHNGYFLGKDAARFATELRSPSSVTLLERASQYTLIPLMETKATPEADILQCFFLGDRRFVVRMRIPAFENGKADFVYEGDFAMWVRTRLLTPSRGPGSEQVSK